MSHAIAFRPLWLAATVVVVAGCQSPTASPSAAGPAAPLSAPPAMSTKADPADASGRTVVARVGNQSVTRDELDRVLYRSYGINLLADLAEQKLATAALAGAGLPPVTDAEVAAERQRSFEQMFEGAQPDEYDAYYRQLLQQKHLTDEEFNLGFRTTAVLRKLARPTVAKLVTDDAVAKAFGILYGENRRIADIAADNVAQAERARAFLAGGGTFDLAVQKFSVDEQTRASNGVWPPFSAMSPSVPVAIKDAAFALKQKDDVSPDVINVGNRWHVIKLLEVIPPKLVKLDDVRAAVREKVERQYEQSFINQYRQQLRQVMGGQMTIDDPDLRAARDRVVAEQAPKGETLNPDAVDRKLKAARPATTAPATAPAH